MKKGDKLYCKKDRIKLVFCGCLFNGMGSIGPGVGGSMENPLTTREEIDGLNIGETGTSYYFLFNSKGKTYEVVDIHKIPEGKSGSGVEIIRISCEECDGGDVIEEFEIKEFFDLVEDE